MRTILTVTCLMLGLNLSTQAATKVIYGQDNRLDIHEVRNAELLKLAKSTAGMIHLGKFARTSERLLLNLVNTPTLERGQNICASETFSQQPLAPNCSGFLVGQDLLITAGHCYKSFDTPENVCKNFAWVFDYHMASATHDPTKNIHLKNIYLCKSVVSAELSSTHDFAIIKLDRKVVGREPLKFRTSGKISDHASLVVIGHPSGLPTKVSDAGKVTRNSEATRFSTTLDTFQGNSGSAVFDLKTGLLEGILIQGKTDYVPSITGNAESCQVVNICDESAQTCASGADFGPVAHGEVVLRMSAFLPKLQQALKAQ